MARPIITVDGISKAYRIGLAEDKYPTFREALLGMVKAPFRRFQKLRERDNGDDIFWRLKDVSFEVQPGEVLGIIGRNGAGKTTLLKILSRITEPTEGTARLRGRVASLLEVGTGFHPELTGRENVYLNGAILGMKKTEIDRKFDDIVAFAGLEKFIDTPVKRYSSGMYARLAFAVAAHLEPEVLFVDEVLAVGDIRFQRKCLGKMQDVAAGDGRTVLFVSHSMPMIERLCERTVLLDEGRIASIGRTADVIAEYLASVTGTEICWERQPPFPQNPHFRRAWLIRDDGTPCTTPTTGSTFGIAIEFSLPDATPGVILGVAVCNRAEQPLFASSPLDCGYAVPNERGIFRCNMLFPVAIFMPKQYSVILSLYAPNAHFDCQRAAVMFQVLETASLANEVVGGRYGDLQVECQWSAFERTG